MPRSHTNSATDAKSQAVRVVTRATQSAEIGHLTGLLMDSPAFVCSLRGPNHIVELANKKFLAMNGGRDIIGKPLRESVPEAEGQDYFATLERVYASGESFAADEMPVLLKNGTDGSYNKCFVNFVYQAIRNTKDEITGVFIHGIDVTDQVRARETTREKENWLRLMTNTLPQIVWIARPDGFVESANQQGLDYIGITNEQGCGDLWLESLHPDDVERTSQLWRHCIVTGETYETDYRIRRHDGQYRWFLSRALPVKDHNDNILKWFGTCTDIEDWRKAKQQAEDANRQKDEFLATLSHELRTPLNAILGWAQLLQTGNLDKENSEKALGIIERSARTQGQLIEDILDVSRIMSGKIRLDLKPIHLTEIVEAAIEGARPAAVGRDIALCFDSLPHGGLVSGDVVRMQQIVWNLLTNAIKFTPEGGRIEIGLSEVDNMVQITIKDNGLGMAPEFLPHIFDRFRQADSSSTRGHSGLGLGLAIVRQLVEAQSGTIQAYSEGLNQGSTFIASFPLLGVVEVNALSTPLTQALSTGPNPNRRCNNAQQPPRKDALKLEESPTKRDLTTILNGLRILVVDDEIDALVMLRTVLDAYGAHVTVAASVSEALAALDIERPHVLISDIGMPGEDGYSLMQRLRTIESENGMAKLPAVAVTAFARDSDKAKAIDSGYQHHVPKPVEPTKLVAIVSELARG